MATPYLNASNPTVLPGRPVIVKAQDVSGVGGGDGLFKTTIYDNEAAGPNTSEWKKGEHQQKRCRDVIWAILFYAHLVTMAYFAFTYMPQMASTIASGGDVGGDWGGEGDYENGNDRRLIKLRFLDEEQAEKNGDADGWEDDADNDADITVDIDGILSVVGVTGLTGLILSTVVLGFMMKFSEILIKASLIFNIALTLTISMLSLYAGNTIAGVLSFGMFFIVACYAWAVWARVPFAASNLVTACTSVQANLGLSIYAYLSLLLSFGWSAWWTSTMLSTAFVFHGCNAQGECEKPVSSLFIFLFALSYYWTVQVIANVVHVTVAGTVATWWFAPLEANSCCSKAVRESYIRSITYSFGSICLGSLIVAIVQAIREVIHQARESGDSILMCCAECCARCIESLIEYFNKWAFVFVGIYGYSFVEASLNVMTLFKTRGWTTIITDDLVDKVLLMVSMGVGIVNGIIAVIVSLYFGIGALIPFLIGFVIGLTLSAILFSVVSSAVATVIVCYAEAPAEFQANHPELAEQMRLSWRQAWPVEFNY